MHGRRDSTSPPLSGRGGYNFVSPCWPISAWYLWWVLACRNGLPLLARW
jgi:hypothetical protein